MNVILRYNIIHCINYKNKSILNNNKQVNNELTILKLSYYHYCIIILNYYLMSGCEKHFKF